MIGSMKRMMMILGLTLVTALSMVAPALADTLHLKDGRVLQGEVQKEADGYVWFVVTVGGIKDPQIFTSDQITKIERTVAADASTKVPDPASIPKSDDPAGEEATPEVTDFGSATRVCFISQEEMVGPQLNADALKRSVELAESEKPDIIVLVFNSGGGALAEVEPLSDLIHKELKEDYRVVAWIRSAISAASLTAFNCEELYMMGEGNVGGTVAFVQQGSGQTKALEGRELESVLRLGELISKRGKRNPLVMRAMQLFMNLSADITPDGDVIWYEGTQGKFMVNPENRILTFNAIDAEKYKISRGTADTKDELLRLMGVNEWVEVGVRADRYQQEFRKNVQTAEARMGELQQRYDMALQAAGQGQDEKLRAMYIGRARSVIDELQALVRRAPSLEKYNGLDKEWFENRREELRKMLRPEN